MPVLVFAEQRNGSLRKSACEAVSQGRLVANRLGDRLIVSMIGQGISSLSDEVTQYGADDILLADDEIYNSYQTEAYGAVVTKAIKDLTPQVVLFAHTAMGKDLAPRIAERVGAGLVSDCIGMAFKGENLFFLRPMYAGKVIAKLRIDTPIQMATLRPNNFRVLEKTGEGIVKSFSAEMPSARVRVKEVDIQMDGRPDLTEAEIIVSGGRGLGNAEGFEMIEQLADALGGAVGASRAAVDAGWRNHQDQVGQTGKVVTPKLYVACGISGAIQHMAGMGSSRCIVAVNKDPEANIMKVADVAIEGDLYEVVPELVKKLESHS
jgi:electron transfer flavoprotein alpha subunit